MAVPVAAAAHFTSSSGFVADDFGNLLDAQTSSLSFEFLARPIFGHFAPGRRLVEWVLQALYPGDFQAAWLLLVACFAISLVLLHRILVELFGAGPGPVLVTVGYGASAVHVGTMQWWSSGVDIVPATLLSFASILAYLRFFKTGRWALLAASAALLGAGQLFYVKPIFVPLYLVLMRVLLLEPERPVEETLRAAVAEWRVWAGYALVVGAFLAVYVPGYPIEATPNPGLAVILEYLAVLWFRAFLPSLLGVWTPLLGSEKLVQVVALAAQLALAAVVAWSIARWRPAWRAWAFFAVAFLVNAVTVGTTRIGFFRPDVIAYAHRFNVELYFVFAIALCGAFSHARWAAPAGAVLVGVACLGLSLWAGHGISQPGRWVGARSRVYVDHVRAEMTALTQSGEPVALVERRVPEFVVPALLGHLASTAEVLPALVEDVQFDPRGRRLYDIDARGRAHAVDLAVDAGGRASIAHDGECVTPGPGASSIEVKLPSTISGADLAALVEYRATAGTILSIVVQPDPGPATSRMVRVKTPDRSTRVFSLDAPTVGGLRLEVPPRAELCVHRIEVGRLMPRQE